MPAQRSDLLAALADLSAEARTTRVRAVAIGIRRAVRAVKQVLGKDKIVLVLTVAELRLLRRMEPLRELNETSRGGDFTTLSGLRSKLWRE